MITDEDPLRGLLFYLDLGFSHTLHVLKKGVGGANTPISGASAAPFLRGPRCLTTRTPGPVTLAAVAHQTSSARRASHLRKARFDASNNAHAPLSDLAPSPQSFTKNSASRSACHQANIHSDAALSPGILPSVSETKGTTTCSFSAQACLSFLNCARWPSLFS